MRNKPQRPKPNTYRVTKFHRGMVVGQTVKMLEGQAKPLVAQGILKPETSPPAVESTEGNK